MNDTQSDDLFTLAPKGQVYICAACGKRSPNRAGFVTASGKDMNIALDRGWDESCMLHAVLCYEEKRDGKFWAVPKGKRHGTPDL